ncbi:MAG: phage portal protein [Propionibacterium sp.]|nr:phage portal protein [Propionibacterium sp.]
MSIFFRERRSYSGSPFPEPIVPPFPGMSIGGGMSVTPDTALQVSAVWACVRLLADAVSMMPLHAFTMRDGVRVPVDDPSLIISPSSDASMPDFIYMVMVSLLLKGNAYGRIVARDGRGYPTQIELQAPDRVSVSMAQDGTVAYRIAGKVISTRDIWHVRAYRTPGAVTGLSPIAYAASTIGTQVAAENFAGGYFQDAPHPSAILVAKNQVTKDQARAIKESYMASVHGREIAVLGAGVEYQGLSITPEESQFLETKRVGVAEIARYFGVTPEMIGGSSGSSMTYANVTQRAMDFLTYSVQPWLGRLEASLFPLLPGRQHVRFDTSVLVRLAPQDRWLVNKTKLTTGASYINEIRAEEDLPPVEWGNEPYMPGMGPAAAGKAVEVDGDAALNGEAQA